MTYLKRLILVSFIFFISCGNPAIIRYLSPVQSATIKPLENPLYTIYKNDKLLIQLQNVTQREIEEILKYSDMEYGDFRLPPLTYLKFYVQNLSSEAIQINLSRASLVGPDKTYPVLTKSDFSKRFTSIAYHNLNYDKMFSLYTLVLKKKIFSKEVDRKFPPDMEAEIKPNQTGTEILPFEFISESNLQYELNLSVDKNTKIKIPLKYVIFRNDKWGNAD